MFIDRITLVRVYTILNFIQINEGKGSTNAHIHNITFNKKTNGQKEKKPAFAHLANLAHTIQTQYPYIQYNYKGTLPTYKESIWSLVSFQLKRADATFNIQIQPETNWHILNGLSIKKLRTLKRENVGTQLKKEFEYKRYVQRGYMPKHYVQGTLSKEAQTLLDTYYKETRDFLK